MSKKAVFESAWVIGFIFLFLLIKSSILGFYLVPSTSMVPNIVPGDRILTNKLSYGLWLPFFSKPLFSWSLPKRGDIILFESPNDEGTFVKRVVGLPGDVIRFQRGVLFINDHSVQEIFVQEYLYEGFLHQKILEESKDLGFKEHSILSMKERGDTFFESRRFVVPPNKLFVLGDNRDNSSDSRSFGYVDKSVIYGKVVATFFSTTGNNQFLPDFRGERFLKRLY